MRPKQTEVWQGSRGAGGQHAKGEAAETRCTHFVQKREDRRRDGGMVVERQGTERRAFLQADVHLDHYCHAYVSIGVRCADAQSTYFRLPPERGIACPASGPAHAAAVLDR